MADSDAQSPEQTVIMDEDAVGAAIHRLAQEIAADNPDIDSVVLLGILRRGRPLAERIALEVKAMSGTHPRVGSLATTLYRDDLRAGVRPAKAGGGETHFDFNVDGVTVVLVDDVVSTGRTVRAALDEVMDYGRPRRIQLACLIDRGLRELPIQADYLGWSLSTAPEDHVAVKLRETDGEDLVVIERVGRESAENDGG